MEKTRTAPPRRRVTPPTRRARMTYAGTALILIVTIGGGLGVYKWLQFEQRRANERVAVVQAQADLAEQQYQHVVARVQADADYREYALAAANAAIQTGQVPQKTDITLLSPHRDPSRLDIVVDKHNPIYPLTFAPTTVEVACGDSTAALVSQAARDFGALCAAARQDGVSLRVTSSYRSYSDQVATYTLWIVTRGQDAAETFSARPGYSEHQTGTTLDLAVADGPALDSFCGTSAQKWLARHAHTYGFIQRYTKANELHTGFGAECWHYRYVGRDVAAQYVKTQAVSLETFWNVTGGSYTKPYRG